MRTLSIAAGYVRPAEAVPFVCLCALAGLAVSLAVELSPIRRDDGLTPAHVAAAVVAGGRPDDVGYWDETVVHHAVGVVAGTLYAVAYLAAALVVPAGAVVGRVGVVPHVLAVTGAVLFVYAAFATLVLSRAERSVYEERSTAVRGQWLRSSVGFGAGFAFAAPIVTSVL